VGRERKTETESANVRMVPWGQQINVEVAATEKVDRTIRHHVSPVRGTTGDPGLATIMHVDPG